MFEYTEYQDLWSDDVRAFVVALIQRGYNDRTYIVEEAVEMAEEIAYKRYKREKARKET